MGRQGVGFWHLPWHLASHPKTYVTLQTAAIALTRAAWNHHDVCATIWRKFSKGWCAQVHVLYEDEHMIAVNKPPDLLTAPKHRWMVRSTGS